MDDDKFWESLLKSSQKEPDSEQQQQKTTKETQDQQQTSQQIQPSIPPFSSQFLSSNPEQRKQQQAVMDSSNIQFLQATNIESFQQQQFMHSIVPHTHSSELQKQQEQLLQEKKLLPRSKSQKLDISQSDRVEDLLGKSRNQLMKKIKSDSMVPIGHLEGTTSGFLNKDVQISLKKELNRHAQRRYRDRKREQFQQLQQQLESLTNEADRLRNFTADKERLQAQTSQLTQHLSNIDFEIENARIKLQSFKQGTNVPVLNVQPQTQADEQQQQKNAIELLQTNLKNLHEFLHKYELDNPETGQVKYDTLEDHDQQQLKQLVEDLQRLFRQTSKYVNMDLKKLVHAIPSQGFQLFGGGQAPWSGVPREHCLNIVQKIQLSEQQVQDLLQLRAEEVPKIDLVCQNRQILNTEFIRRMLPQEMDEEIQTQLENVSSAAQNFSLARASSTVQFQLQINDLKQNLMEEQKFYCNLQTKISEILSDLQVAWVIQMSSLEYFDSLDFVNAVFEAHKTRK